MSRIIRTIDLSRTYTMGQIQVHALRKVNISARAGETLAIMGPSGSGKTTLLNLIGALDRPTTGKVLIDGVDTSAMSDRELTRLRRAKIGFVFQFYNLIPILTAYENVELPLLIANKPEEERKQRVEKLLTMIELEERAHHRPDELSGGEQQRVAIARSLANQPSIVLADEPTGDLDEKTGLKVVEQLIESVKKEKTCLIVVTHDPIIAERMDRVLKLRDGRIIR